MPQKKYIVDLTPEERTTLEQLVHRGKSSVRKLARAHLLLQADEGLTDAELATARSVGIATVERTRQRFVEERLGALEERIRPGGQRKLSGKQEAQLIAVACPPAPTGQPPWTRQLLADKVGELGFADSIARETVRPVLKKTRSSPGSTSRGVCRRGAGSLWPRWKRGWIGMPSPLTPNGPKSTSMRPVNS
jgi:transposase